MMQLNSITSSMAKIIDIKTSNHCKKVRQIYIEIKPNRNIKNGFAYVTYGHRNNLNFIKGQ